jgi:glutathione peroxidase
MHAVNSPAIRLLCAAGLLLAVATSAWADKEAAVPAALNFKMKKIDGKEVNLADYKGKVVLMVNVASACGYTPQYEGLQAIHEKYGKDGLVVVGVPANEFGAQEPGSNDEIATFCKSKYGVSFDMFQKVVVKGAGICPLYKHLTSPETNPKFAGDIGWNFEKFLIGRNGEVVGRFKPGVAPESEPLTKAIEAELAKK